MFVSRRSRRSCKYIFFLKSFPEFFRLLCSLTMSLLMHHAAFFDLNFLTLLRGVRSCSECNISEVMMQCLHPNACLLVYLICEYIGNIFLCVMAVSVVWLRKNCFSGIDFLLLWLQLLFNISGSFSKEEQWRQIHASSTL